MIETKMTEYIFELRRTLVVKLYGSDTDNNYLKALDEATQQVKHEIDDDWFDNVTSKEYTDYEMEETYA